MNTKHLHLDEPKTKEISDNILDGKNDIIIACDECREGVIQVLEGGFSGDRQKDDAIRMQKYQLEMTAFFYKEEVERLRKNPQQAKKTEFGEYLKKVLGAKRIIGGDKVLSFPTTPKKEKNNAEA